MSHRSTGVNGVLYRNMSYRATSWLKILYPPWLRNSIIFINIYIFKPSSRQGEKDGKTPPRSILKHIQLWIRRGSAALVGRSHFLQRSTDDPAGSEKPDY
jgi:hypothetical protein